MAKSTGVFNMRKYDDLTGRTFGYLLVTKRAPGYGRALWQCLCECGQHTITTTYNLRSGKTKSCGHLKQSGLNRRHGMRGTSEYNIWKGMKDRCANPFNRGWINYGGRGIAVCDRWRESFEAFYDDMGPRPSQKHSIDRINNNGHYEPDNCHWAVATRQQNNRRNNRLIWYRGEFVPLGKAIEVSKTTIDIETVRCRLNRGWTGDRVIDEPLIRGRPKRPELAS